MEGDRHQRRLVRPVFEQLLAAVGEVGKQVPGMDAEAGEEGQLVGTDEHVDRVDLNQPDRRQRPPGVAGVDPSGRPALTEALRHQRDAPGLGQGEGLRAQVVSGA